jgi:hypothetical protein
MFSGIGVLGTRAVRQEGMKRKLNVGLVLEQVGVGGDGDLLIGDVEAVQHSLGDDQSENLGLTGVEAQVVRLYGTQVEVDQIRYGIGVNGKVGRELIVV